MTTSDSYITPEPEKPQYPNWRDLDLSTPEGRNALNREIARRLGHEHVDVTNPSLYVSQPLERGKWYTLPVLARWLDKSNATPVPVFVKGEQTDHFPTDWANSVDAALMLVDDSRVNEYRYSPVSGTWTVKLPPENFGMVFYAEKETLALAICCAWLAMMDAKGGV